MIESPFLGPLANRARPLLIGQQADDAARHALRVVRHDRKGVIAAVLHDSLCCNRRGNDRKAVEHRLRDLELEAGSRAQWCNEDSCLPVPHRQIVDPSCHRDACVHHICEFRPGLRPGNNEACIGHLANHSHVGHSGR